eukprot:TRINITY_DN1797_c1_g2_i2.p1 TRINITY_DN1797_c1_g2~~TRINITY_DN1797_c1_g2_i2.p1  ORF type:complete len:1722 (+),score=273.28 TRINITY_DN1797_c1_g2_i2:117-5168(+)
MSYLCKDAHEGGWNVWDDKDSLQLKRCVSSMIVIPGYVLAMLAVLWRSDRKGGRVGATISMLMLAEGIAPFLSFINAASPETGEWISLGFASAAWILIVLQRRSRFVPHAVMLIIIFRIPSLWSSVIALHKHNAGLLNILYIQEPGVCLLILLIRYLMKLTKSDYQLSAQYESVSGAAVFAGGSVSPLQWLGFGWIAPLISQAFQRTLDSEDVLPYGVPSRCYYWDVVFAKQKPFYHLVWTPRFAGVLFMKVLVGGATVIFPLLIRTFLEEMHTKHIFAFIATAVAQTLLTTHENWLSKRTSVGYQTQLHRRLVTAIIKSKEADRSACDSVGLSSAVRRLTNGVFAMVSLVVDSLLLITITYLLYLQVDWPFISGVSCILVLFPLNFAAALSISKSAKEMNEFTQKRTSRIQDIFDNIESVKLLSWYDFAASWVGLPRDKELSRLSTRRYYEAALLGVCTVAPVLVMYSVILTCHYQHIEISVAKSVSALVLCSVIVGSLTGIPSLIARVIEADSAYRALVVLLSPRESGGCDGRSDDDDDEDDLHSVGTLDHFRDGDFSRESVTVTLNGRYSWKQSDSQTPKDCSIKRDEVVSVKTPISILPGDLVAIVGNDDTSKSNLMWCLMGEMESDVPEVNHQNVLRAYSPSKSMVFSGTVYNNITLGKVFNKDLCDSIMAAASLNRCFPHGGSSYVTDTVVSNQERAKISIARTLYSTSHIALLEDPLELLDIPARQRLLNYLVHCTGKSSQRSVVLSLGNSPPTEYLRNCTKIIKLFRDPSSKITTVTTIDNPNLYVRMLLSEVVAAATALSLIVAVNSLETGGSPFEADDTATTSTLNRDSLHGGGFLSPENVRISHSSGASQTPVVSFSKLTEKISERDLLPPKKNLPTEYLSWVSDSNGLRCLKVIAALSLALASQASLVLCEVVIAKWKSGFGYVQKLHLVVGLAIFLTIVSCWVVVNAGLSAARNGHERAFNSFLRLKDRVFILVKTSLTDQLMAKFRIDIPIIDLRLPDSMFSLLRLSCQLLACAVVVCLPSFYMLSVGIPTSLCYIFAFQYVVPCIRETTRLEEKAVSNLRELLSQTVSGGIVMRQDLQFFETRASEVLQLHCQTVCTKQACLSWLRLILSCAALPVFALVSILAVINSNKDKGSQSDGITGLALLYAFELPIIMCDFINCYCCCEKQLLAVQQLCELQQLDSETPPPPPSASRAMISPPSGSLNFKDVVTCLNKANKKFPKLKFCAFPGSSSEVVCEHRTELHEAHWSCCGLTVRNSNLCKAQGDIQVGHTGEWMHKPVQRNPQKKCKRWCSVPGFIDGILCEHTGIEIRSPHWSCCGSMIQASKCSSRFNMIETQHCGEWREGQPQYKMLKNINTRVVTGERIAVLGDIRSGKTSIMQLLTRTGVQEMLSGSVLLDNRPIEDMSEQLLRQSVAGLPTTPFIFEGSIAYNIDPFNQYQTLVIKAVTEVQLFPTYSPETRALDLPKAHQYLVSLARIVIRALARAALKANDPLRPAPIRVLVVDSLSEYQPFLESCVLKIVAKVLPNATLLVAVSQMDSLMSPATDDGTPYFDSVFVMEDGKLTDHCSISALIHRRGSDGNALSLIDTTSCDMFCREHLGIGMGVRFSSFQTESSFSGVVSAVDALPPTTMNCQFDYESGRTLSDLQHDLRVRQSPKFSSHHSGSANRF